MLRKIMRFIKKLYPYLRWVIKEITKELLYDDNDLPVSSDNSSAE